MKSFQDRLFKDFDVHDVKGRNGKTRRGYVYVGDYAVWNLRDDELKRHKRLYALSGLLMIAVIIWKSLIRSPINSSRFVGAFTLLSMAALIPVVMGIWGFVRAEKKMYMRDCVQTKDLILWGSTIFMILQLATVFMGIVYMISLGFSVWSLIVTLAGVLLAVMAFIILKAQLKLTFLEIPGEKKKEKERL